MTREEEICKAAEEFAFSNKTETSDFRDAINDFYYGAKWADENPQMRKDYEFLFMLKKQKLIKKACEWLNKTLYIHTEEIEDKHWNEIKTFDLVTSDFDSVSDFIEGFLKAMEE